MTGNWHLEFTSTLRDLHLQSHSLRRKYLKLVMIYNIFNSNSFVPDLPICFIINIIHFCIYPSLVILNSFYSSTCPLANDKKLSMLFTSSLPAFNFLYYVLYNVCMTSINF